jgi:hypothetical protein
MKRYVDLVRANDTEKLRYDRLVQSVQQLENKRSQIELFVTDFKSGNIVRGLDAYMNSGIRSRLAERRSMLDLALFAVVLCLREDQNMFYLLDPRLMNQVVSNPNQLPGHVEWKKLHQFRLFETMSDYYFDIVRHEMKDELMSGRIFEGHPEIANEIQEKDRLAIIKMVSDKTLMSD